jgi:hypothetical protein
MVVDLLHSSSIGVTSISRVLVSAGACACVGAWVGIGIGVGVLSIVLVTVELANATLTLCSCPTSAERVRWPKLRSSRQRAGHHLHLQRIEPACFGMEIKPLLFATW